MRERGVIAVYIMASDRNGTLYIGVTSDLYKRTWQHKGGEFEGFSKQYHCTRLVWFERFGTITEAIRREKRLKLWLRKWKLALIEAENPEWRDLADDLFDGDPTLDPTRPSPSSLGEA